MKKTLLLGLLVVSSLIHSQDYRYTNTLFTDAIKTADVIYGTAPFLNTASNINESSTTVGNLVMDIYTPDGDTETNRPAIIFAHAGGFINGHRNHEDIVLFCQELAKKGYVTATIDYRKGFYVADDVPMHGTRAVYRGIQDGRSAVRFLRANATTYGIDPDKVYFGGSSAGAFIALHSIYMQESEKPAFAGPVSYTSLFIPFSGPDLGPLDNGDHLGFNGTPDAVISLWGAIQTPDLITTETTPIYLVHGTADGTVPYDTGYPFAYPLMPTVYGSKQVNDKLDLLGFTNKQTYFVTGEDHEFYGTNNGDWPDAPNAHWDIIFDASVDFLWDQHKPNVDFTDNSTGLSVEFTDASSNVISWLWDFGDGNTSTQQNPTHVYATPGTYNVKLYVENDNKSWNETSKSLTYAPLAVTEIEALNFTVYPNPTKGSININSQIPLTKIELYSILGKKVLSTTTNLKQLNIATLASGMYIIKAYSNDAIAIKRIVKN